MYGKLNTVIVAALLGSGALMTTPAIAQKAGVEPGMQVVDTAGNPVGIITSLKDSNVVLKTDKHEVQLPAASFTPSKGKLLFGMTQAQVDTAAEQAVAQAEAAITPGAQIFGQDGALAGTIDAIDAQYVTIKLTTGALVRVPRSGVAAANGKVIVGATLAQLESTSGQASAASKPALNNSGS
jgi:preprotein translocase subunit YajC